MAFLASVGTVLSVDASEVVQKQEFVFRYNEELSSLPESVAAKVSGAHGGFAVDSRTGEVFFGLKGAGVIWMSPDLSEKRVLPVTNPMAVGSCSLRRPGL